MDLLWWMVLIFCDLCSGGWKTTMVGWVFEGCDWWCERLGFWGALNEKR